jgi:predicted nucleic acid-binding protein
MNSPLLDSNIIIDLCNGRAEARDYLKQFETIRIPSVAAFETLAGCTGERRSQLDMARVIFEAAEIVSFGLEAAEHSAELYMESGSDKYLLDYFIAGTAKEHGLEVATRNPKDFKSVKAFEPYTLKTKRR